MIARLTGGGRRHDKPYDTPPVLYTGCSGRHYRSYGSRRQRVEYDDFDFRNAGETGIIGEKRRRRDPLPIPRIALPIDEFLSIRPVPGGAAGAAELPDAVVFPWSNVAAQLGCQRFEEPQLIARRQLFRLGKHMLICCRLMRCHSILPCRMRGRPSRRVAPRRRRRGATPRAFPPCRPSPFARR